MFSNKVYDVLVKVQRWIPLFATAYLELSEVWGWAYGLQVNKSANIIAVLLAGVIEVSISIYNKNKEV